MSTVFRVDRSDHPEYVPCGMNALLYLGGSYREAVRALDRAELGRDAWNQPDPAYGVNLSQWDGRQYVVRLSRFP